MPIEPARWCTMVDEENPCLRSANDANGGNRVNSFITRKRDAINVSGFNLFSQVRSLRKISEKISETSCATTTVTPGQAEAVGDGQHEGGRGPPRSRLDLSVGLGLGLGSRRPQDSSCKYLLQRRNTHREYTEAHVGKSARCLEA